MFINPPIREGGHIAMRDIQDEVNKRTPGYLEIDGDRLALTEISTDDKLRAKAIKILNAKMKPYRNKDFPPEITTAWLIKLYLRAKGRPNEGEAMIEDIRRDLVLGELKSPNFDH
jgi:hypothetical protein